MNRDQITKDDFPAGRGDGYDRASVDAHLTAVAAWTAALEAQINALEVERDALRDRPAPASAPDPIEVETVEPSGPEPVPTGPVVDVEREERSEDEVSARLVATRLALEGSERDEIVARLSDAYELDEPEALVDDVLARLA